MTDFSNNLDTGTGMTVDQAATAIESILDFGDDTETTDTNVEMDETTEIETTDEIVEDQPELESETFEDEEEVSNEETEEAPSFNDDTEIDIGESKVSLKELKSGYLRQADYTKKTQELAVVKTELEGQKVTLRKDMLDGIQAIKTQLAVEFEYNYAAINWQELAQNDPFTYAEKKEQATRFDKRCEELHAIEMQARQANADAEMATFRQNQQNARVELVEKHPVFADPTTAKPILRGMANLLKESGFTKDEIEGIADSRILDMVYRIYQADQANKAVPRAKSVIATKPKASAKPVSNASRSSNDRQQFQKSGSIDDAAKLIAKLL